MFNFEINSATPVCIFTIGLFLAKECFLLTSKSSKEHSFLFN